MGAKRISQPQSFNPVFAFSGNLDQRQLALDCVAHHGQVGDREFREKSSARIEEMVRSDTTVVIVSHDMEELRRLCTRMLLVDKGKVVCDGTPDEVIARYMDK